MQKVVSCVQLTNVVVGKRKRDGKYNQRIFTIVFVREICERQ